jgi:formylglycine-generating enzyme required for sulfatase activity
MPQLTITRHPATIHYFTEDLGNQVMMDMVLIPAGSFEMGSPKNELEQLDSESPQHRVTVPTFFMGRTPVTQAQWRQVAKLPEVKAELKANPSYFKGDNRPVEQVSWNDATEFYARLSRYTNREYRLPSEAEWEYACRAGTTTPFHFGETIDAQLANYQAQDEQFSGTIYPGKYGRGKLGEYRKETFPVGSFPPNQFGLQDMHGNVWEWCQDIWHDSYKNAPTDGSAWEDGESSSRVLRGGSWLIYPRYCRSAFRSFNSVDRYNDIGFRVVCCVPRTLV